MQPTISTRTASVQADSAGLTANKVVPLLQALNRAEELVSSLALRLDPITNHPPDSNTEPNSSTVTGKIQTLGNILQYLLDNIEL